jgi:hypothetical protein
MTSVLEMLARQLGGGTLNQLSRQLGTDEKTTGNAVSAALPVLLAALAKNSARPGGAQDLLGALDRDHDGGVLNDVTGFLQKPDERAGNGILGHLLGGRRGQVEQNLSKASGLDAAGVAKLMTMLAPIVMGALGRKRREENLDAGSLSDLLTRERTSLERQNPQLGGLVQMLDADGDGQVADDIASIGKKLLGGLFRR